jgi:hypothetical protein
MTKWNKLLYGYTELPNKDESKYLFTLDYEHLRSLQPKARYAFNPSTMNLVQLTGTGLGQDKYMPLIHNSVADMKCS